MYISANLANLERILGVVFRQPATFALFQIRNQLLFGVMIANTHVPSDLTFPLLVSLTVILLILELTIRSGYRCQPQLALCVALWGSSMHLERAKHVRLS